MGRAAAAAAAPVLGGGACGGGGGGGACWGNWMVRAVGVVLREASGYAVVWLVPKTRRMVSAPETGRAIAAVCRRLPRTGAAGDCGCSWTQEIHSD